MSSYWGVGTTADVDLQDLVDFVTADPIDRAIHEADMESRNKEGRRNVSAVVRLTGYSREAVEESFERMERYAAQEAGQ